MSSDDKWYAFTALALDEKEQDYRIVVSAPDVEAAWDRARKLMATRPTHIREDRDLIWESVPGPSVADMPLLKDPA